MSQGSFQIIYCFLKLRIQTTKKKIFTICNKKSRTKITAQIKYTTLKKKKKKIFPNICRAGKMFLVPDFTNILDFFSFKSTSFKSGKKEKKRTKKEWNIQQKKSRWLNETEPTLYMYIDIKLQLHSGLVSSLTWNVSLHIALVVSWWFFFLDIKSGL